MKTLPFKGTNWEFPATDEGRIENWSLVQMAILRDIRDELKRLNELLYMRPQAGSMEKAGRNVIEFKNDQETEK